MSLIIYIYIVFRRGPPGHPLRTNFFAKKLDEFFSQKAMDFEGTTWKHFVVGKGGY